MTNLEKIAQAEELAHFYAQFDDARHRALALRWLRRAKALTRAMRLARG